ncbi:MAG: OmpH family outer membrane protein [Myxococcales bacterium]|nr:OmpH family outer membrane protein [Myxococcales bacterium]
MAIAPSVARPRHTLRRLLAGTVLAAALAAPAVASADTKIAVIDLRRAVVETEDGLRVQAKLKQLFDHRQTDLDELQKSFQQAQADFEKEKKSPGATKEVLAKKDAELKRQAAELQSRLYEYQSEMRRQENELTVPIVQRMMGLLRRLAAQNSIDVVLDKQAVPYFRSDLDVTDRVIQMYNSGEGGTGTPGTPGGVSGPGTGPAPSPAPTPGTPAPAPAAPPAPKKAP